MDNEPVMYKIETVISDKSLVRIQHWCQDVLANRPIDDADQRAVRSLIAEHFAYDVAVPLS